MPRQRIRGPAIRREDRRRRQLNEADDLAALRRLEDSMNQADQNSRPIPPHQDELFNHRNDTFEDRDEELNLQPGLEDDADDSEDDQWCRLRNPRLLWATESEVQDLLDSLEAESEKLRDEINELAGENEPASNGISLLRTSTEVADDHLDQIPMANISRFDKVQSIQKELLSRLANHNDLVEEWSENVVWLWNNCQPTQNQEFMTRWNKLLEDIQQEKLDYFPNLDNIDDDLEQVISGEVVDDGEDAEEEWIDVAE
ncbi:hypothetical protein PtB15_4B35 [Puccinia triticina]|nr:hypothetical protein PtB15_4B35 [Puccinia triticina]